MPLPTSKISYRFYFTFLFLGFGTIIALLTSVINYNLDIRSIKQELNNEASNELSRKHNELSSFTESLEGYVASLRNNPLLHNFILQPNTKNRETVNQLFYALTSSNPALMQVRFLNAQGMETIRIDWNMGRQWPDIVEQDNLQDKSQRYYFIEASQVPPNSFWASKLDLNIEHKKIEVPHKPVLRIASPVYVNQQFRGIVLINIHAKEFLKRFIESSLFDIAMVDRDGHYLMHYQEEFSWSRYLQTGHTLTDDYPEQVSAILHNNSGHDLLSIGDLYTAPLHSLLKKDQASLLFIPKNKVIQGMKHERRKATIFIIAIILLLTIPLSLLISRVPAKLNQKITDQNKILQKYVNLIDHNIITATTDTTGIITEVSTAFCQVSGFSKEKLLGQKPHILQHPDIVKDVKPEVWEAIQSGKTWIGEFHNQTQNGKSYWLEATIFPSLDKSSKITGYTAIYHDITDKKRIETLSITDALTGLYNRRFFDETIKNELSRAMRDNKTLGFAMLDVDYFKQYNDHYGHQKGDEVLSAIGQTLQQTLTRSSDFCFRLGGEEFGILFSDLSPEQSLAFTEIIREAIEGLAIEHQWSETANFITASFGLLTITPGPGITVDTIYQKADQALYRAKQAGRNRTFSDLLDHSS